MPHLVKKKETSGSKVFSVTLNDMNHVFIWADKSSIYTSLDAELFTQGFWVPFNEGVVSACLVDVHFIILLGFFLNG